MKRPTPILSEPLIIARWWRNRRGEMVRVRLSRWEGYGQQQQNQWEAIE